MKRSENSDGVPLELLTGVTDHRKGLRWVELHQLRGRNSYQPVPGERWELHTADDAPTPHDGYPADDAATIARELHEASRAVKARGGDPRFLARLFQVTKDGATEHDDVKFSVDPESAASAREVEISTREDALVLAMQELRESHKEMRGAVTSIFGSLAAVFQAVGTATAWPAQALPKLLELRMDAFEDRAAAHLLAMQDKDDGSLKEKMEVSVKNLKQVVNGPVGRAVLKKMGIDVDDEPTPIDPNQKPTTLRGLAAQLGKSITPEQKAKLINHFGLGRMAQLRAAGDATTDDEAKAQMGPFIEALNDKDAQVLDSVLDEPQLVVLGEILGMFDT